MRYRYTHMVLAAAGVVLVAVLVGCGEANPGTSASGSRSGSPSTSSTEPPSSAAGSSTSTSTTAPSTTTPTAGSTKAPQQSETCTASDVKITLGKGNGAAGSYYAPLRFTNTGDEACVVAGYPGVSYVAGEDAHQVGAPAERAGDRSPAVTLAPGEVAHAPLRLVRVQNYPTDACEPTSVRALRVYAPGETASTLVSHSGTGCASADGPGPQLTIKPVRSGPGGR